MNNEIKQMIDNLKFISEQESATIEINQNGSRIIYDYITNLQEENERLKKQEKVASDMSKEYFMRNKKAYKTTTEFENWLQDSDLVGRATIIDFICEIQKALNGGDKE